MAIFKEFVDGKKHLNRAISQLVESDLLKMKAEGYRLTAAGEKEAEQVYVLTDSGKPTFTPSVRPNRIGMRLPITLNMSAKKELSNIWTMFSVTRSGILTAKKFQPSNSDSL